MSKILYEVYKNDIKDSESVMYGKYYARLKSIETMSMAKMAKHISEHGSVFTEDVVEGVMKKFKTCLLEMLLESKKVKVSGLGTFYLTCECQKGGADKEEGFNPRVENEEGLADVSAVGSLFCYQIRKHLSGAGYILGCCGTLFRT